MKRKRNGLFYSKKEETINSISHGIGIAMGVIVSTLFLIKCYQAQNVWAACGVWLYLFGMGGSYLASTLYHSLKHHNPWKRRLRHWDHAAIYWHIAGSYSPIILIALREDGGWGWGLFGFVWLCAIIGTVVSFRKMPATGLLPRGYATSREPPSTPCARHGTCIRFSISLYWAVQPATWWLYGTYW